GFHFPDSLKITGVDGDLIGHEQMPTCFFEDEVGIRIAPATRISAHGSSEVTKNSLELVMHGPAIVQVKLEWATMFTCEYTRNPGGTSTFTVFPDGRIVRHDRIGEPPYPGSVSPSRCACDVGAEMQDPYFRVATYWTFARARFETLFIPGAPLNPPLQQMLPSSNVVVPNTAA